ncbi:MAG: hypothetical protein AB7R67_20230 [Vicinamibacterales bacterium]
MSADDRDWSWLRRPAPVLPASPEHSVWALEKAGHTCAGSVRATPWGPELRVVVDGELLWSHVYRGATDDELTDAVDRKRAEFEQEGWTNG